MYMAKYKPPCLYTDIVAIDPGSDTLGIALLRYHFVADQIEILDTVCLHGAKGIDKKGDVVANRGERFARIRYLSEELHRRLVRYAPNLFIAEAPFMGRIATAFEALVETRVGLMRAVENYNPYMNYIQIDPRSVKMVMGTVDSSKDAMRDAVLGKEELIWTMSHCRYQLTEHEYDAIGVGCWLIHKIRAGG